MRKFWKKVAVIGAVSLMLNPIYSRAVYAMETGSTGTEVATETGVMTESDTTADSEQTTEAVVMSDTEAEGLVLNYVYVEQAELNQGSEQAVVVSVDGIQEYAGQIEDIQLGYELDGSQKELSYSEILDDMIVFRSNPEWIGEYHLTYVRIVTADAEENITFADSDIAVSYVVNEGSDEAILLEEAEEIPVAVGGEAFAEELTEVIPQAVGSGTVVVVLDPGHDNLHCGAAGNGLREENVNLKIALYCKEELEKYNNVKVYMTRSDGSCLDTSSNGNCMKARCNYAASVNADLLVSIHIDAGSVTGTGALVIVAKNGVYRDDLSTTTQEVGTEILEELSKLGLASRGLYIRMSDSAGEEFTYPNGATADWYSITRNSIKVGVPGIIVEHGFISNPSDVAAYLNSDEKLQALGIADATGIAEYFNLSKELSVSDAMKDESTELYTDTSATVGGFVANLYQTVMGRTPSRAEVSYWVTRIANDKMTGVELVKFFLDSEEFKNKNYSNEEYVERLYEIFLGRATDEAGKAYWVAQLEAGMSPMKVTDLIGTSPEFEDVCMTYGMACNSQGMQYTKLYPAIADFVTEYYNGLLNRNPDAEGLEYWTRSLIQGNETAANITRGFIYSQEFLQQEKTSEEFVEGLYLTYLGRASDAEGKQFWMEQLPNMSQKEKETVIRGFISSEEYKNHCEALGIRVGSF